MDLKIEWLRTSGSGRRRRWRFVPEQREVQIDRRERFDAKHVVRRPHPGDHPPLRFESYAFEGTDEVVGHCKQVVVGGSPTLAIGGCHASEDTTRAETIVSRSWPTEASHAMSFVGVRPLSI